jgi:hypothetical protein
MSVIHYCRSNFRHYGLCGLPHRGLASGYTREVTCPECLEEIKRLESKVPLPKDDAGIWMTAKYPSAQRGCKGCDGPIHIGDSIVYSPRDTAVYCESCGVEVAGPKPQSRH